MVKVTVSPETDASAPLVTSMAAVSVTDADGNTITLKKPGVLAQFRLVEAMGDSARNQVYMGMVLPLLFVTAINGESVAPPESKGEVEALIKRLDESGIQAVMTGVQANFAAPDEETQRKN